MGRDYDGSMGLALVVGPAKAGKIARLLEGYLAAIDQRSGPDRPEQGGRRPGRARPAATRRRAARRLDRHVRRRVPRARRSRRADARPVTSDAQRTLVARRALARHPARTASAAPRAFAGFADALLAALGELESGLLDPEQLEGRSRPALLGVSRGARPARALGPRPAPPPRGRAASIGARRVGRPPGVRLRIRGSDRGGMGSPRGAVGPHRGDGLAAVRARSRRVCVAPAHAGGSRSARGGRIEELPARAAEYGHAALAHLERHLFADDTAGRARARRRGPLLRGRRVAAARSSSSRKRFASSRPAGTPLEEIALVVPSIERWRASLETVLGTLGIPFTIEGRVRLGQTPFGQALLALLRFEWQLGGRRDLYAYLRSPFSGFTRSNVDFLEGRLRGRGVSLREAVEEETIRLRDGQPLPPLEALRSAVGPVEAVRAVAAAMLRGAHGLEAPPVGESSRADLRAYDAIRARSSTSSTAGVRWAASSPPMRCSQRSSTPRCGSARRGERGRVAVLDLARARTRRFDAVFLLGLEEGTLPRRGKSVAVPRRRRSRRARPGRAGPARAARRRGARALPLLHRLHARHVAVDARPRSRNRRGKPTRAEPLLGRGGRALRCRRTCAAGHVDGRSRSSRGSSRKPRPSASGCGRSPCSPSPSLDDAQALAAANGWERQLERARASVHARDEAHSSTGAGRALGEDAVQRHRARTLRRLLVGLVLRAADLAAADRQARRRHAARVGRAHDAAPLLRRPAAGDRQRPRRGEPARRRARASSASAWRARSAA